MKKLFILFITAFSLVSCGSTENIETSNESKIDTLKVTTSIIPLASIANYIGGDFIDAKSLVPSGVSPHGFDIKANQMIDLEKSDLIIYLGLDHVDGFLDKAIEDKENVVFVKTGIDLIESDSEHNHEHEDEHHDEDEHEDEHHDEEGHEDEHHDEDEHEDEHHDEDEHEDEHHDEEGHSIDPHIWTSAENSYIIAKTILDELVSISPENEEYFESNFKLFKNELESIKQDFEEKTSNKEEKSFIVFHDAYNYLFEEMAINGDKKHVFRANMLSDPNSSELKELIDEIKEEGITISFKEPQLDSSSLEYVSSEYNLEVLNLDPLGTDESKTGYIENYKNNLENLVKIYD